MRTLTIALFLVVATPEVVSGSPWEVGQTIEIVIERTETSKEDNGLKPRTVVRKDSTTARLVVESIDKDGTIVCRLKLVHLSRARRRNESYHGLQDEDWDYDSKDEDATPYGNRGIYASSQATVRLAPDGRCLEVILDPLPEVAESEKPDTLGPFRGESFRRYQAAALEREKASLRSILTRTHLVLPEEIAKGEATSEPVAIDLDCDVLPTVHRYEVKRVMGGVVAVAVSAELPEEYEALYDFRNLKVSGSAKLENSHPYLTKIDLTLRVEARPKKAGRYEHRASVTEKIKVRTKLIE